MGKGISHARRSDTPEDLLNEGPRQVALGRDRQVVGQFENQTDPQLTGDMIHAPLTLYALRHKVFSTWPSG